MAARWIGGLRRQATRAETRADYPYADTDESKKPQYLTSDSTNSYDDSMNCAEAPNCDVYQSRL
jgi:hypothetical protein